MGSRVEATSIAGCREAFPMAEEGRIPPSDESPSTSRRRPWILRFARTAGGGGIAEATAVPETFYDPGEQISLNLHGGLLPYMATHSPTVVDGDPKNPPSLDEGAKD